MQGFKNDKNSFKADQLKRLKPEKKEAKGTKYKPDLIYELKDNKKDWSFSFKRNSRLAKEQKEEKAARHNTDIIIQSDFKAEAGHLGSLYKAAFLKPDKRLQYEIRLSKEAQAQLKKEEKKKD